MNGWIKYFTDGSTEIGADNDDKASWTKGRLSGINSASVHYNETHIAVTGAGDYWQSDDFDSILFVNGPGEFVVRRIAKKLRVDDRFIQVLQTEHSVMLKVIDVTHAASALLIVEDVEVIPTEHSTDWLILEYDVQDDSVHWYYSGEKI